MPARGKLLFNEEGAEIRIQIGSIVEVVLYDSATCDDRLFRIVTIADDEPLRYRTPVCRLIAVCVYRCAFAHAFKVGFGRYFPFFSKPRCGLLGPLRVVSDGIDALCEHGGLSVSLS